MHPLESKSVFVTGGTGFIGSHLVRALTGAGARVHVLVRPGSSLSRIKELIKSVTLWEGDIRDQKAIKQSLIEINPEIIFHLAGNAQVRLMGADPEQFRTSLETNFLGTINLIRSVHESKIKLLRFIQTGGLEEYGNGPTPYDENQRESPVSLYSANQVAATHFCQMLHRLAGFPVVILRPALIYGPYQTSDFLVPALIQHCFENRDFKMTAGNQERDYLYVGDLIDAYLKTATRPEAIGEIINIGSGTKIKIRQLAEMILGLTQKKIQLITDQSLTRSSEIHHLYCRNDKAKRLLKWNPQTSLEEGLRETIARYN